MQCAAIAFSENRYLHRRTDFLINPLRDQFRVYLVYLPIAQWGLSRLTVPLVVRTHTTYITYILLRGDRTSGLSTETDAWNLFSTLEMFQRVYTIAIACSIARVWYLLKKKNYNANKKISFPVGYLLSFFLLFLLFFFSYILVYNVYTKSREQDS